MKNDKDGVSIIHLLESEIRILRLEECRALSLIINAIKLIILQIGR